MAGLAPAATDVCALRNMMLMNHVERFRAVMNFQLVDRLPRWEPQFGLRTMDYTSGSNSSPARDPAIRSTCAKNNS